MRQLLASWTGRILLVNAAVFVAITIASGTPSSLLVPSTEVLLRFGAKDPTGLAQGELWRLFAPVFIHIGVIHFAVNSYMLHVVGRQLESLVGAKWFLATYLAAGVLGNVASAVFSVQLSAGASGAIFGLLGLGFYLERAIGNRLQEITGRRPRRVYAATVAMNLALGLVVPFIDNAAHLGGLVAGVLMALAMVNLRENSLLKRRRGLGFASLALMSALGLFGAWRGTSEAFVFQRLVNASEGAKDAQNRLFLQSQALTIRPKDWQVRLARAGALFAVNEAKYAIYDVREALTDGADPLAVEALAKELDAADKRSEAWQVRRLIAHLAPPESR